MLFPGRGYWVGVEVEAFPTTPDIKGTTTDATIAGFPIPLAGREIPGTQLTVTTVELNAARGIHVPARESREHFGDVGRGPVAMVPIHRETPAVLVQGGISLCE
jgi:hypothetical protein